MFTKLKALLKKALPTKIYRILRLLWNSRHDLMVCISFMKNRSLSISFADRLRILTQLYVIDFNLETLQTQEEILNYIQTILSLPLDSKGVLVEAGCYKGSSTAKFSLAAEIVGRELVVFDSFEGLPENNEPHDKNIFGGKASFKKGDYCGSLYFNRS